MKTSSAARIKNFWETPTDLSGDATVEISGALRKLLADVFVLYMKTKNFHWHMSGKHFRDYHLLLDEQATSNICHDRRHRGAGAQDRRNDAALHQGSSRSINV
jgi:hypothetical protein